MQVVSDRMHKSVTVAVSRQQWVQKYKFWRKRTSKMMVSETPAHAVPCVRLTSHDASLLQAHDELDQCRLGDTVRIQHGR